MLTPTASIILISALCLLADMSYAFVWNSPPRGRLQRFLLFFSEALRATVLGTALTFGFRTLDTWRGLLVLGLFVLSVAVTSLVYRQQPKLPTAF